MKKYTIEDLSNPQIYEENSELASIAKTAANIYFEKGKFNMGIGDFKKALIAGKYPDLVKSLWDKKVDESLFKTQKKEEAKLFVRSFTAPDGYNLEIQGEEILIKGPYCADLGKRVNRLGYWDGLKHKNRKCFVIPVEKGKSLKNIFSNWQKGNAQSKEDETKNKNLSEINKWLGYVENAAKEGRIYQNGLDKLKVLNINEHAELDQKLKDLVELAKSNKQKESEKPKYGQSWKAEKISVCSKCKTPVIIGDNIRYKYQNENKFLEHVDCEEANTKNEKKEAEAPFNVSGGSGYGCHGWSQGQVFQTSKFEQEKGHPEFLYVVESSKKYFKYDGLSFGVGDESGYIYNAKCREANPEEAAPLKNELAHEAAIKKAKSDLKKIKDLIMKDGDFPEGKGIIPEGEIYFDTQNIYGSGDWFVISTEWIWYIKNNGMDGDSWANNNIRTGGAGALGWRIPFKEIIFKKLEELSLIIK